VSVAYVSVATVDSYVCVACLYIRRGNISSWFCTSGLI